MSSHRTSILPSPTEAFTPARVICAGICALVLCVGIARFAYTPLLPVMRDETGLSRIEAGWLATINYVGYLGGAVIASAIHSLRHKFVLYRIGLVVAVVTTIAMGLTTDVRVWIALRLVSGWSGTAGMLLGAGLTMNWLLRRGYRPDLGVFFAGVGAGIAVSGLVAVAMAGHLSWSGQWYAYGALGLVLLVPAWIWMPSPATTKADGSVLTSSFAPPSRAWMGLLHFSYFSNGIMFVITATFIVDIIRGLHAISMSGTWVWIVMGCVAIPACFVWDRIADMMGATRALVVANVLLVMSCVLLALGGGRAPILLAAVLYGGTITGTASLTLSIVGKLYPENPARPMAQLTVSYGVAQIIGPIVAGYMSHGSGHYGGALLLAAAIGCVGVLAALALTPPVPATLARAVPLDRRADADGAIAAAAQTSQPQKPCL